MGMVLNTNIGAIQAQRAISESRAEMESAMERLSTGRRINSAADDAAGLAMVERMNSQIRGLTMATKNANDGIALIRTVENALVEVSGMLQRMRELAVQSANATNSATERAFANNELNQLQLEISRVSANTRYNGTQVLNGTFSAKALQVGTMSGEEIHFTIDSVESSLLGAYVQVGENNLGAYAAAASSSFSNTTNLTDDADDFIIVGNGNSRTIDVSANDSAKDVAKKINSVAGATTVFALARTYAHLASASAVDTSYQISINGTQTAAFTISSNSVTDAVSKINAISATTGVMASATTENKVLLSDIDGDDIIVTNNSTSGTDLTLKAVENDGVTEQTATAISLAVNGGNDTSQVIGTLRLSSSSGFTINQTNGSSDTFFASGLQTAGLVSVGTIDISTAIGASYSIATIDGALERASSMRGSLGTLQNRLDYAVSNLMKVTEYTIGARSRIEDADFAAETSRLAKAQVLQQAGASMLSQANASTDVILQVLRG
jgi:flagellin